MIVCKVVLGKKEANQMLVLIEGLEQHMLQGTKWQEFLTRGDNKKRAHQFDIKIFSLRKCIGKIEKSN